MSLQHVDPYKDIELHISTILHPSKLNSNIKENLHDTLITSYVNKCYKNYGIILKIYKILEHDSGVIQYNDPNSSILFNTKISCKICVPEKDTHITCEINEISDKLISCKNGPILCIIPLDTIDKTVFDFDQNNKLYSKKHSEHLKKGDFIIVKVSSIEMKNSKKSIFILGALHNIASDQQIEKFYDNFYK